MYPVQVCAISFLRFDEIEKNHWLAVSRFDQAFGIEHNVPTCAPEDKPECSIINIDKNVARVDITVLPNKKQSSYDKQTQKILIGNRVE